MRRRRIWKIILLVILVLLLAFVGVWYANYRATKSLKIDFVQTTNDSIAPPSYLYMFNGTGKTIFKRPVGVTAANGIVYVTDSEQGLVYRFTIAGKFLGTFGKDRLVTPIYLAANPKNGNIYVTDRSSHAIQVFDKDGKWLSTFKPNFPKDQQPKVPVRNVDWMPIALGFGPDGSLYVTELLNGHRVVKFDPSGKFVASVGVQGLINKPQDNPDFFSFPNSVKVHNGEVWVVDSNNRRVKVYSPDLKFKRVIDTKGLPRGLDFLARSTSASTSGTSTPDKFATVDILAHGGTIWNTKGERLADFGKQGILEGEFSYPSDISVGPKDLLFVTDSVNGRVQVWGWPSKVSPIPTVTVPPYWAWCLAPLLLLPFIFWFSRKRRFVATADFVEAMVAAGAADQMPSRRRQWLASQDEYERIKNLSQGEIDMAELFEPMEFSESDVRALVERLELSQPTAVVLSIAQRAKVFCTTNAEYRRYAKVLDIDVVNTDEYLARYGKNKSDRTTPSAPAGTPVEDD